MRRFQGMSAEESVNLHKVMLFRNPGYGQYMACVRDINNIAIKEAMADAVLERV